MYKIDINSNVKIYFIISWILGLVSLFPLFFRSESGIFYLLIFISFFNFFFNVLVIIFLVIMFFTFTENRTQFLHSMILLFINFPFVIFFCLVIFIITDNL